MQYMCSLNFSDHCCYCLVWVRNWQRTSFVVKDVITSQDLKDDVVHPDLLMEISITQIEVEVVLVKLNVHIKQLVTMASLRVSWMPMTKLFNLTFRLGKVPFIWKRGKIISVFKMSKLEDPDPFLYCQSWANARRELFIALFIPIYRYFLPREDSSSLVLTNW